MDLDIHAAMTREALETRLSPRAIDVVIAANLRQDSLRGLIFHDEFHFDNNAFDAGYRYLNEQRGVILSCLLLATPLIAAWAAFGRLLHAVQDYYSHTNYVALWLDLQNGAPATPDEIDPLRKDLIRSPKLISARVYYAVEALYFVPFLRNIAPRFSPADSHATMNLDSPRMGPRFPYARAAAVKRSEHEFEILEKLLPPEMLARFTDS